MSCQGILEGGASCPNDATERIRFAGTEGGEGKVCRRCALRLKMQAESFGTTLAVDPLPKELTP